MVNCNACGYVSHNACGHVSHIDCGPVTHVHVSQSSGSGPICHQQ